MLTFGISTSKSKILNFLNVKNSVKTGNDGQEYSESEAMLSRFQSVRHGLITQVRIAHISVVFATNALP